MISAAGLSRRFNGNLAVDGLTFAVPDGKLFVLLGPNGAGKTTTVRMLLGLIAPTAGAAEVAGIKLGGDADANNRLRSVCGLLTETPGFYDRMSAWENLRFFAHLYQIPESGRDAMLERHLKAMALWERRDHLVGTYSKGMKQKLAIIRAVFHEPKVIFLDEPTSGLDPEASLMVREMILGLKGQGRTIVVCTHNLDEAQRLADLVGIIRQRLLVFDTLANLQGGANQPLHVEVELAAPWSGQLHVTGAELVRRSERRLTFQVTDAAQVTPRLVSALVAGGASVLAVRPQARDLESIYLQSMHNELQP